MAHPKTPSPADFPGQDKSHNVARREPHMTGRGDLLESGPRNAQQVSKADGGLAATAVGPASQPAAGGGPAPKPQPRLLDTLRRAIRMRHYSIRTEAVYVDWVRRYIRFNDTRHPNEMGAAEVAAFLSHLAVDRDVSPSTQSQAKSALMFLYRVVLNVDLPWLGEVVSAKSVRKLPVVLTPTEVRELLLQTSGSVGLVCSLLYGTGMRLLEGLRLRVKDVEFVRREVLIRHGKGGKDRVTVLPENLILPLQQQIAKARALHQRDLLEGFGSVWMPGALDVKYPGAPKLWGWQWVFPSSTRSADPKAQKSE